MRDFVIETAVPVFAYFIGVALCIGIVIFTAAIITDVISDPTEIALQEDAQ